MKKPGKQFLALLLVLIMALQPAVPVFSATDPGAGSGIAAEELLSDMIGEEGLVLPLSENSSDDLPQAEPEDDGAAASASVGEPLSPLTAAAVSASDAADFTYTVLDETTCAITGYSGAATELTVPETLDGYTVRELAMQCFSNNRSLASVTLPDTVTFMDSYAFENCTALKSVDLSDALVTLGHYAFYGCSALESIVIPDSVTRMGRAAFENCTSLSSVTLSKNWKESISTNTNYDSYSGSLFAGCTSLKSVSVPEGVTALPDFAFQSCNYLEEVILPSTLETIPYKAFNGCTRLTAITLPDSVTTVANYAFQSCQALASVSFGAGLTAIGEGAFQSCQTLKSIALPEGIQRLEMYTFASCRTLESVTLPDTVTFMDSCAFENCAALTSVDLSDALVTLGHYAFRGCSALESIVLPDSIARIGRAAFENCKALSSVTIPKSWKECISTSASNASSSGSIFAGCTSLKSLSVPEGVTALPEFAFQNCDYLEEVILPSTLETIPYKAFYSCTRLERVTLPSLTTLGESAFQSCRALKSITLPEGIQRMEMYTFADCRALETATLPDTLTFMDSNAFDGCAALQSVDLGSSLVTLGHYAFRGCSALERIVLPDSVARIGRNAFEDCTSLTSVTIPKSWSECISTNINNDGTAGNIFLGCTALKSLSVPEGVTALPKFAFQNCDYLEEITLPSTLETISYKAFYGCTRLGSIVMPDSVTTVGDSALRDCSSLAVVSFSKNLNSLGQYAFYNCAALKTVTLPDGLTEIPYAAFSGCSGLLSAAPGKNTVSIGSFAFENCAALSEISLPDGLTTVSHYAFSGCAALTSVALPDSVTTMGYRAFRDCTRLTEINYPASLSSLPQYSSSVSSAGHLFDGCTKLTELTIPEGVTTIPKCALQGFATLKELKLPASVTAIGERAFFDCSALEKIYIGPDVTAIGSSAFTGCSNLTIFGESGSCAETFAAANNIPFTSAAFDEPTSGLYGKVLDSEGDPIPGVEVTLYHVEKKEQPITLTTDAAGIWSTEEALSGAHYRMYYYLPGYTFTPQNDEFAMDAAAVNAGSVTGTKVTDLPAEPDMNFTYRALNGAFCEITGYTGTAAEIRIPETIGGLTVERIADSVFLNNHTVTKVVMPDSVTSMGSSVFQNCSALRQVWFSRNLTELGQYTLRDCTALTAAVLPAGITSIGYGAFTGCTSLQEIHWAEGLTTIGHYAFSGCSALETVVIPDSVTTFGRYAFRNCTSLAHITLPTGWNYCAPERYSYEVSGIFAGCTSLTEITVPEGVTALPNDAFRFCDSVRRINLPSTLERIGDAAFLGCRALESVNFPENLTHIGAYAFEDCSALLSIALPESCSTVGSYAFRYCTALASADLGGVTTVERSAFSGCSALKELDLGEQLIRIDHYAFNSCAALTEVVMPDTLTTLGRGVFENCSALSAVTLSKNWNYCVPQTYAYEVGSIFSGCTSLTEITVPEGVTALPNDAFRYCESIVRINLPSTLERIGDAAFLDCRKLASVNFPENLTHIGASAFENCTALGSVRFGSKLTEIGSYAFQSCSSLAAVALPESVKTVGDYAFRYCSSLASADLGSATVVGRASFSGCSSLKELDLGEQLTSIGHYAFNNCTALTEVVMPDTLTTLGRGVFENCSSLSAVTLSKNWNHCANEYYAYEVGGIFLGCTSLTEITVPEGVTTLPDNAFRSCDSVVKITLPSTLERIGDTAFLECRKLASVNFPEKLTSIGVSAFENCSALLGADLPESCTTVGNYAFRGCSSLASADLGGVTVVGRSAFSGCSALKELDLGEKLTEIGHYAFYQCTALTEVVMPDTLTTLGRGVFENCSALSAVTLSKNWSYCANEGYAYEVGSIFTGCTSLTEITVPEGVTALPDNAFRNCGSLRQVYLPSSLKTIGNDAFTSAGITSLSLPETLTSIGSYAFNGCTALTSVYAPMKPSADATVGTNAFIGCSSELVISCYNATNIHYYAEGAGIGVLPLDAHEHELQELSSNAPTCTAGGYVHQLCSICGYVRKESSDALGHDFAAEFTEDIAPTCQQDGRRSRHCSRCDAVTDEETLPRTDHVFTGWIVTKDPTPVFPGTASRRCNFCDETETMTLDKLELTGDMADAYGIVHFHVIHAQDLTPVSGAGLCVQSEEGDLTAFTDSDGHASLLLPVGQHRVHVAAAGMNPRSLSINVVPGEQELPDIGVSDRPPVDVELKHRLMTIDEIEAAGIDTSDPSNQHVYLYQLEIRYRAELDLLALSYMFNSAGELVHWEYDTAPITGDEREITEHGGRSFIGGFDRQEKTYGKGFSFNWLFGNGESANIHVTEKFLLIIYGEVKWLKEMFDVEMVILNNSLTDSIGNGKARLFLPDGLSLAAMKKEYEPQTLEQDVPEIEPGGTHTVHWYVRGDKEGSYDIMAELEGDLMPFEEHFLYSYQAEDPIKVYAGSAFELLLEVPQKVYYGTNADIRITLTNVSDRTMYNVSHVIHKTQQKRLTYTTENGKTTMTSEDLGGSGGSDPDFVVREFHPGDRLIIDCSIEICFDAKQLKQQFRDLLSEMKKFSDGMNAISNAFDAAEDLTDFTDKTSDALDKGLISKETLESAESLRKLTEYTEFQSGKKPSGSSPGFWNMLDDLVDSLPIVYILEGVDIKTMKDSTTSIPWRIKVTEGLDSNPLIPAGSISMSKLIYSIAILIMGRQDVEVGGISLLKDYTNTEEAYEYVKYCWEQTAAIRAADPTGKATFHTYYVPAGSSPRMRSVTPPTDVSISVAGNDTAVWEGNVLTFTGPGIIEVTPHTMEGGTLYVQVNDEEPRAYIIDVTEPHECAGSEWEVAVPATESSTGFRIRHCDICGEICEIDDMTSCGDHSFGDWVMEAAPVGDYLGIRTHTCTKCGVLEYEFTDGKPFHDIREIVEEGFGRLLNTADGVCLLLPEGCTADTLTAALEEPLITDRFSESGEPLDRKAAPATGQTLSVAGLEGELTLVLPGDLDGSGDVDAEDTGTLLGLLTDMSGATQHIRLAADLTGDSILSLWDAAALALMAEGREEENHRVFAAVYDENDRLLKIIAPEIGDQSALSAELVELSWQKIRLFVADGSGFRPLVGTTDYEKPVTAE